jgi:hypothetical protein
LKKLILLTIILSTLLFSNDTFDISRVNFGSIEFKAKTKMRIYNQGVATFNLPIEISSHTKAIKKTKTGYLKKSTFKIKFTAIRNDKMTFTTETLTEFNKNKKLTKFTEKIDRNGETQTVVCVPLGACLIDGANKKKIGDKSDVVILECDNNTQKKIQCNVEKANKKGLANLTTKKHFIMENNNIKYNIEEITKMTVDKEGNIKKISSKIKAKDLFSIKYTAKDIVQSP